MEIGFDLEAMKHYLKIKDDMGNNDRTIGRQYKTYVFFNEDEEILYIGVSGNLNNRLKSHRRTQPWWDEVRYIAYNAFKTRKEAEEQELELIQRLNPKYNIAIGTGRFTQMKETIVRGSHER